MAAPGAAGIFAALTIYVLLTSNFKTSSVSDLVVTKVYKHFGFGRYVLARTFIHPCFFNRVTKSSKTILKPQQSLQFIIAICLLLSGDIHQCPGPINFPEQDGTQTAPTHSGSSVVNFQVHTSCTSSCTFEQTHLNCPVSLASAVVAPVAHVDVAAGWTRRSDIGRGIAWAGPRVVASAGAHSVTTATSGPGAIGAAHRTAACRGLPCCVLGAPGDSSPSQQLAHVTLNEGRDYWRCLHGCCWSTREDKISCT